MINAIEIYNKNLKGLQNDVWDNKFESYPIVLEHAILEGNFQNYLESCPLL